MPGTDQSNSSEDLPESVQQLLDKGNKVAAIKELREITGMSLLDAKLSIEGQPIQSERRQASRDPSTDMNWNKVAFAVFLALLGIILFVGINPDISFSDLMSNAPPLDKN